MTTPPLVWDGVLRRLGAELPESVVASLFAPVRAESDGGELRLSCPTAFHRDRLRDRYLPLLERHARAEAGCAVPISLWVTPRTDPRGEAATPRAAPTAPPPRATRPRAAGRRAGRSSPVEPPVQCSLPYTFDSFVVGPCNALAREASLAVAQQRQLLLNPLFLTSDTGFGKTHLARATATEARAQGGARIVYTSAESFTGAFTSALRSRQMDRFKRRFRSCDLLVVEDVQFLGGKTQTQLELFHTLTHLLDAGSRVVFSADRLPREIGSFDRRLASQMTAGFVAELEPPDAQVRRSILRAKAAAGGVRLPEDCLDLLVESLRGSVRDLTGVLVQLVQSAALLKHPIDRRLTEEALRKVPRESERSPALQMEQVIEVVCGFAGISREAIASRSRRRDLLVPRQLAMYLCRRYTEAPVSAIAAAFGRDHPSVRNAERVVARGILERAPLRYKLEELVSRLDRLRG